MRSNSHRSGGDLKTFAKNIVKEVNPIHQVNNIRNVINNNKNSVSNIDNETKDYANLIKETYKNPNQRQNQYNGYTLNKDYSGDHYSTYEKNNKKYFVFRGTKNKYDIPDDLKIATGTENFDKDEKLFQNVKQHLGDNGEWTLLGHSLGATKAILIGQHNNIKTHAFNPGYSRLFEDKLELSRPDLKLHLVASDPISNGLLVNKLNNATVYKSKSYNPIQNHSINYFT